MRGSCNPPEIESTSRRGAEDGKRGKVFSLPASTYRMGAWTQIVVSRNVQLKLVLN